MCYQDRVEASPEQLASAMATAEKLSEGGGPRVRVIGWYHRCMRDPARAPASRCIRPVLRLPPPAHGHAVDHLFMSTSTVTGLVVLRSHPHITVLPSHVDVRTQAAYQMLDEGFVGIIISAFNRVRPDPFTPLNPLACHPFASKAVC